VDRKRRVVGPTRHKPNSGDWQNRPLGKLHYYAFDLLFLN
jgi:hypothetical protein